MNMHKLSSFLLSGLLLSSSAWGAQAPSDSAARANNDFGWSLFQKLQQEQAAAKQNLLFSPLSAWLALSLASNGAEGETLEEMQQVLHTDNFGLTESNQSAQRLLTQLVTEREGSEILRIANAVWVNSDSFELAAKFQADVSSFYAIVPEQEVVRTASFRDASTVQAINAWVAKSTGGMIPSILNKVDPGMASILLNALYFQGQWLMPFSPGLTDIGRFRLADGSSQSVRMMRESAMKVPFASTAAYKMVSLPFRASSDGIGAGAYVLDLVLPQQTEASILKLRQSDYEELLGKARGMTVAVTVPKFKFNYEKSIARELNALGMRRVFRGGEAQLAPLGHPKQGEAFISNVLQKTAIEMAENGLKAAAVTAVIVSTTSAPVVTEKFVADRPFFFALRHRETGALLFQGVVSNPGRP